TITPAQLAESMPITPDQRTSWIAANGAALQAAYDKEKASRFDLPERIRLKTIRLPFTETDKDAITARMEALRGSIAGGESIADLALRWSEDPTAAAGGDLGERRLPTLTTKVREAVADLAVGQISAVVDETDRLALYQVVERKAPEVIPLAAVQDELADKLMAADRANDYATRLAAAWKDASRPEELLTEGAAFVQPIPGVRLFQYRGGPGNPPKAAIEAAKDAEVGSVFGPFPGEGPAANDAFLIRVTGRPEVDRSQLDGFRQQFLDSERQAVWNAFGDDLQSRARINTGGGEATQGGWWEYFSWLLPES
ncbi:MAG: peptidylprolyl isomerase, partial [Myxococcota bacterium]